MNSNLSILNTTTKASISERACSTKIQSIANQEKKAYKCCFPKLKPFVVLMGVLTSSKIVVTTSTENCRQWYSSASITASHSVF